MNRSFFFFSIESLDNGFVQDSCKNRMHFDTPVFRDESEKRVFIRYKTDGHDPCFLGKIPRFFSTSIARSDDPVIRC